MMSTFSKNLKRFRMAKNLTQEQAAEALGVSAQTISRWECETTLPDVAILPSIARLYCVSIDDLYQETSVAYDNYAQRLASVYRSTMDPADFVRADTEFRQLFRSGTSTAEDIRIYGILHQYMMAYCMKKAVGLFDKVLEMGPDSDERDVYWRTRHQKLYIQAMIGKSCENIASQRKLIEQGCDEIQEWICLIAACQYGGDFEQAYEWFQKANAKFPDQAMIYVYGGDICACMERNEEAFCHWDRALELDPDMCDAKHSKGFCYERMGDYQKAYEVWCEITEDYEKKGFDVEAGFVKKRAEKCADKMQN